MSDQVRSAGPSLCPNCSAIVSAGEPVCPQCGAALAKRRPVEPEHDPKAARFIQAIVARPAPFTLIFIFLCTGVYFGMMLSDTAATSGLVAFGAKVNRLLNAGEWWRVVTPIFLHVPMGGLPLHLIVNMWALWNLGPYVEKLYGSAKFVVIWVLTGICGVIASYYSVQPGMRIGPISSFFFKAEDMPSAGASGALFGLFGVLIVFGIKYRHELPAGLKQAFGTGLLPVLLINLGIGYFGRGFIDNAAHVGGLVSGMVLALVIGYERPGTMPLMKYSWRILQIACLVLIAVSYFMLWRHYTPPPTGDAVTKFMVSMNRGRSTVMDCADSADPAKLEKEALAKAANDLAQPQHLSPAADALSNDLLALVRRCEGFAANPNAKTWQADSVNVARDFMAWDERSTTWVNTEGSQFGLIPDPSDQRVPKKAK